MLDFIFECFNYVNLPVTLLLIAMLLYWLMVIVGAVGLDADFDLDMDADVDLDAGADLDTDIDGASTLGGGSSTTGSDGFLRSVFEFFYMGEIPIVIIFSTLMLFFWVATILTNHYTNVDQQAWIACAWIIPNFIVSLVLTRITMIPFAILFRKPPPEDRSRDALIGLIGRVTTSEVTDKFGQLEIKIADDPEILLNVRVPHGIALTKNDLAKITSFNAQDGTFGVELYNSEQQNDE